MQMASTVFECIIGEMPGFVENPRTCKTEYLRAKGFLPLDVRALHDLVRTRLTICEDMVTCLEFEPSFDEFSKGGKAFLYVNGLKDPCGFVLLTRHEVRTPVKGPA